MMNYMFVLSLLFLVGSLGLALKPSPIYGGLGLIVSGCMGCLMILGFGGSFLGLVVFLVYLGGMMVVFGYTTAMATEEYPETWGSNWLILGGMILGFLMELIVVCFLNYYSMVESIDFSGFSDWLVYEIDDIGVMLEGGVGVAGMYSCATWMMVMAGWLLFAGIFIIIEIIRE